MEVGRIITDYGLRLIVASADIYACVKLAFTEQLVLEQKLIGIYIFRRGHPVISSRSINSE